MNKKIIWALTDDRAGNVNQVLGVANALGLAYERKNIIYDNKGSWPNIIRNEKLLGIDIEKSDKIESPWPDLVIGAGRKTSPIASYIKKQSAAKSKLVQIMWPGRPRSHFDAIFLPKHDDKSNYKNVVETIGSPNLITKQKLSENKQKWYDKFHYLEEPFYSLLIGGTTKKGVFDTAHALDLAKKVNLLLEGKKGSLLISNSRRTNPDATRIILDNLNKKYYFHSFDSKDENPYLGFLSLSEAILVTGDSISMCSEACSTGAQTYIYTPKGIIPKKHLSFHQNLYKNGFASALDGSPFKDNENYVPLKDAENVAKYIKTNILNDELT